MSEQMTAEVSAYRRKKHDAWVSYVEAVPERDRVPGWDDPCVEASQVKEES